MDLVLDVAGALILLLLAANAFFIRGLVHKLDEVSTKVDTKLPVHQNEIQNLSRQISDLQSTIKHLEAKLEDVAQLRERVAVLEAQLKSRKRS